MRPVTKPTYELIAAVVVLIIGMALKACHIDSMVDAVIFLAAGYLFRGGINITRRKP
jgi:hypothetical protein